MPMPNASVASKRRMVLEGLLNSSAISCLTLKRHSTVAGLTVSLLIKFEIQNFV
jgi:hypothetical protein